MVTRKLLSFANDNHHNEESYRPRKRSRRNNTVRFSPEEPQVKVYEDFPQDLSPEQLREAYQRVWYSKEESDAQLQDRLHTIRLWRALGGNPRLMEPLYCLRGLEVYQSSEQNADFLAARHAHTQAVLEEQQLQRLQNNHHGHNTKAPLDWDQVHKVVAGRSAMAARHAVHLAWKDALEAQDALEPSGNTTHKHLPDVLPPMSSLSRRMSMPYTSSQRMPGTTSSRRLSLSSSALFGGMAPTAAYVDVHKLKEMNRRFLQNMTRTKAPAVASGPDKAKNKTAAPAPPRLAHSNSLALLLVRGRELQKQREGGEDQGPGSVNVTFDRQSLHELLSQATSDL